MSQVFISYIREDAVLAKSLAEALARAGEKVWIDTASLDPGSDWEHEIADAIEKSHAFIICLSTNTARRHRSGTFPELFHAIEIWQQLGPGQEFIFPVRFANVRVPRVKIAPGKTLASLQCTDLFSPNKTTRHQQLGRLLSKLQTNRNAKPSPNLVQDVEVEHSVIVNQTLTWLMRPETLVRFAITIVSLIGVVFIQGFIVSTLEVSGLNSFESLTRFSYAILWLIWFVVFVLIWFRLPGKKTRLVHESESKLDWKSEKTTRKTDDLPTLQQYKRAYAVLKAQHKALIARVNDQDDVPRSTGLSRFTIFGALACSAWSAVSFFILQPIIQKQWPWQDQEDPTKLFLIFAGSTALCAGIFTIGLLLSIAYRRYRPNTARWILVYLGFASAFIAGILAVLQLTPEQVQAIDDPDQLSAQIKSYLSFVQESPLKFAMIIKLIAAPLCAALGGLIAGIGISSRKAN